MRRALCKIPSPQVLRSILCLSIMKARKNPPRTKKMSTDKMPASMSRYIGLLPKTVVLAMLTIPLIKKVKLCPKTTHIMAIDLIPSKIFRS